MKPRILLINFTKKAAEKLSHIPAEVDRGFISDFLEPRNSSFSKLNIGERIKFYFPYSIHEYQAIFINLNHNAEVEMEFQDKIKGYTENDSNEFFNYIWKQKRPVIFFLGNYQYGSLVPFGIRDVKIEHSNKRDKTVNSTEKFNKLFQKSSNLVVMPTENYIVIDEEKEGGAIYKNFSSSFQLKPIFWIIYQM